jgi:DNA-binding response OmpR family regulator
MRIAVLDDDSAQADLVCQTLSAAGHVCHAYGQGRELVRQLRRQTFDLLVLDWNVPDMSGEDVLRWVRESLSERLPVLFMTSRGHESDITSILNTGADDYVVKPVSGAVLLARVGSLLRRAYHLKPPSAKVVFGECEFDLH